MAQFDTDKMAQEVAEKAMRDTDFYGKSLAEWIDEMKSGKAVPVVRCRDCAYFGYDKFGNAGCCAPVGLNVPNEDSFCSYGKQRERDTSDEAREMVKTLRWIASNEDVVFNAKSATEAADLIERLAEAGESGPAGWISVKDRLPEDGAPVLVCYIGAAGSIKEGKHCTDGMANYYLGAWYWWDAYGADNDESVEGKITHWMPLPEPPGASDEHA